MRGALYANPDVEVVTYFGDANLVYDAVNLNAPGRCDEFGQQGVAASVHNSQDAIKTPYDQAFVQTAALSAYVLGDGQGTLRLRQQELIHPDYVAVLEANLGMRKLRADADTKLFDAPKQWAGQCGGRPITIVDRTEGFLVGDDTGGHSGARKTPTLAYLNLSATLPKVLYHEPMERLPVCDLIGHAKTREESPELPRENVRANGFVVSIQTVHSERCLTVESHCQPKSEETCRTDPIIDPLSIKPQCLFDATDPTDRAMRWRTPLREARRRPSL